MKNRWPNVIEIYPCTAGHSHQSDQARRACNMLIKHRELLTKERLSAFLTSDLKPR